MRRRIPSAKRLKLRILIVVVASMWVGMASPVDAAHAQRVWDVVGLGPFAGESNVAMSDAAIAWTASNDTSSVVMVWEVGTGRTELLTATVDGTAVHSHAFWSNERVGWLTWSHPDRHEVRFSILGGQGADRTFELRDVAAFAASGGRIAWTESTPHSVGRTLQTSGLPSAVSVEVDGLGSGYADIVLTQSMIAWVPDDPSGSGVARAIRVVRLDSNGDRVGAPLTLPASVDSDASYTSDTLAAADDLLAWSAEDGIYAWRVEDSEPKRLSPDAGDVVAVSGSRVVWRAEGALDWVEEQRLLTWASGDTTPAVLATATGSAERLFGPAVSGDRVAWVATSAERDAILSVWDGRTHDVVQGEVPHLRGSFPEVDLSFDGTRVFYAGNPDVDDTDDDWDWDYWLYAAQPIDGVTSQGSDSGRAPAIPARAAVWLVVGVVAGAAGLVLVTRRRRSRSRQ